MSPFDFLIFVVVGCGVGFLAGLFGIGGGFIIVPILIFSYEYSGLSPSVLTHVSIGTSLFVIVFASLTSAYQHQKQRNIEWQIVFMVGLSSAIAAFATTRLAVALSGKHLQMAFMVVVLFTAIRMLMEGVPKVQKKIELVTQPRTIRLLVVGVVAGMVAALAGIGGGVIIIPMMYYFLHMPLKLAIGTSSATVLIIAFFSVIGYIINGLGHADLPPWSLGFIDLQRGMALAIGSILLARAGAYVSFKTHPYRLRKLFAFFIILVSIYMLLK